MSDQKTLSTVFKAVDQFTPVATKIADAGKNASQDVKKLQDTIKKGVSADAFEKSASTIETAFEQSASTIETAFEQAENRSVSSIEGIESAIERGFNKSIGTIAEMSEKCEMLQRDFNESQAKIKFLEEEIEKLGKSTDDTKDKFEGFGDSVTDISDTIKGLAGAAAAFFGVSAVTEAIDSEMKAVNQFQARVGASAVEMAEYKDSIKALYNDAMGESMEDVANSMATVKVNTKLVGEELKNTTNTALLLRDTFDFDVNESTRSAKMMMDQFGVSGEAAYNLIAQGAQNGLDKNGDLLDTINEYSVHFKQLGFNAEDMLNMLVNGTANGTFSVDKLGDAVKEFGIRAIDGSDTTKEGFKAIGLNADKMAKQFKEGGETGKAAFEETITALKDMKDPIEQNTAGVNLFGTMWEDLGAEGVFALSNLNGKISETSSALKDIEAIKYQDIGSSLTSFGRSLMSDFTDGFTADSDTIVSKIENLGSTLSPTVKELGETAGDAIELVSDAFEFACEHAEAVKVTVGSIIGMVTAKKTISGIASFAEGLGTTLKNTSVLTSTTNKVGGALTTIASGLGGIALPATLAAGAITAVCVADKELNEQLINSSLEEHFGDVTLSLSEMESIADRIVTGGNLAAIKQSLEEFEELDTIEKSIDDTVAELNKLDWKVGVGFELTDTEQDSYKSSISSYISNVQSYVEQEQYTVTLAVKMLYGDSGDDLINEFNSFYSSKQSELQLCAKQLQETVNTAFEDGLLDFDEQKKIQELRTQLAEIQKGIKDSEYKSTLNVIEDEYSGKELTPETYSEMLDKVKEASNTAKEGNKEYYYAVDNGLDEMYAEKPETIENAEKKVQAKRDNKEQRLLSDLNYDVSSLSFSTNTIYDAYRGEIEKGYNAYDKHIKTGDFGERISEAIKDAGGDVSVAYQNLDILIEEEHNKLNSSWDDMSGKSATAIEKMYESIKPDQTTLNENALDLIESGKSIPQNIADGILDSASIGAVAQNQESLYLMTAYNATKSNPAYANMILKAKQSGIDVPEEMLLGIELAKPGAISAAETAAKEATNAYTDGVKSGEPKAKEAAGTVATAAGNSFDSESAKISADSSGVSLTNSFVSGVKRAYNSFINSKFGQTILSALEDSPYDAEPDIKENALGGIYDRPTLTWVAEAGDSEAIIPLNDTQRAYDLWQEAGQAIGAARGYTGTAFTGTAFTDTTYNMTSTNITTAEKTIVIKLEGGGEIKIPKTLSKQDIINILSDNVKPILIDIINQEMFEEGDGVYET